MNSKTIPKSLKVLALDISSVKIGWAVATYSPGPTFEIHAADTFKLKSKDDLVRLENAEKFIKDIIAEHGGGVQMILYETAPLFFRSRGGKQRSSAKTITKLNAFNLAIRWMAWMQYGGKLPINGLAVLAIKKSIKHIPRADLTSWYDTSNVNASKKANIGVVKTLIEKYKCPDRIIETLSAQNRNGKVATGVDDTADAILVAYAGVRKFWKPESS